MSAAAELLHRLSEIGATVQPTGDRLILRAGKKPVPAELVRRLRADKAEVLAVLAAPTETHSAAWWRRAFTIRTLDRVLGNRSLGDATALAFDDLVGKWHWRHGERIPQWQCAGCREPIGGFEALALADGNRVHFETLSCLLRYGERWRWEAITGLQAFGITPPTGFEPE